MTNEEIVRAWKNPELRTQQDVPANPAGDAQLDTVELVGENYLTSPRCTDVGPRCV